MPNLLCPTYGAPPQGTYEVGVPFNSGNTWTFNVTNGLGASYPAVGPVFSTTPGFENISYSYPAGTLNATITQLTLTFSGTPDRAGYAEFTLTLLDAIPCVFSLWVGCTDLTTADTLAPPPVVYGTVTFDQVIYPTVVIGNQTWLASNLVENFGDPTLIYIGDDPSGSDDTLWINQTTGAYTNYNAWTEELNCVYGYLYNWHAISNINTFLNLIGSPFIVPNVVEKTRLRNYVSSLAPVGSIGGKLKSNTPTPFAEWNSPNTGATNLTGFSGLPAGSRSGFNGSYSGRGNAANFWINNTSGANGEFYALGHNTASDYNNLSAPKTQGFSIRLVIPPVPVTVIIVEDPCTGVVTTTGDTSFFTASGSGNTTYTIELLYGEDVSFVSVPDGSAVASFQLTDGPGSISGSGNNYSYTNLTEPIEVTVTFTCGFTLLCDTATSSTVIGGPLIAGIPVSGATFNIPYANATGQAYPSQTISSTGVTGLTATISSGNLSVGTGTLTYTLSGTPDSGGTAAFNISFLGVECTVILDVEPPITLTSLGCDSATYTPDEPPYYINTPLNQNISITYTASEGGEYAGDTFLSTGVTGLTLTLNPTTVTSSGSFTGTITGTATQVGVAVFTICIGGYEGVGEWCCELSIPIEDPTPTGGELDCDNAVITNGSSLLYPGSYAAGNNITVSIPYTAGNGGAYPFLIFNADGTQGVAGLTMSAPAGNFVGTPSAPAPGSILFTVIGTPTGVGNAVFNISIGGYTCEISLLVGELPGDANLDCGAATTSSQVLSGQSVNGITLSIPYTGGNGGVYNAQTLQSTPPGVTATLSPGTLLVGSGTLSLSLSGTMPAGFIPVTFQFSFPEGSPACTLTLTPPIGDGTADLDCNSLSVVGTITYPDPIPVNNPIILYINYSNSNGGSYPAATFTSVLGGVLGLTATLEAGQFALGFGILQLTVTGTPQSSGTASFDVIIGGSSCTLDVTVEPPDGEISTLNCTSSSISVTGTLTNGSAASGVTFTVPYSGSNGGTYPADSANSINIVTGLTATLAPGLFNQPNGTVTYTVTGTPVGSGPATFPITVANQSCTVVLIVDPIPGTADLDCANATFSATPVQGFSTFITGAIPYTNGNGGFYDSYTDTVDGLTLTINSGLLFNNGSGSVPFTIQGIATVSGTITFTNIQVGDQTCNLTITVSEPPPIINDLLCDQATITGSLVINEPANGVTITIPYEGSNEQPYPEDSSNSTGITGLTATTPAGTLTDPTGELIYTVTGTPTTSGVATFTITIGTQTCVISIPVSPPNFFGPEEPSPCQEVTYTDPGCEVLTDTCTILFNGAEVVYTTISTTNPCQVSFQVPCDTEPNSLAEVTFLDCEDNIITTEELPIGDTLPSYLSQTSGCPGDEVTLLDTGCTLATSVTNIQVCYPGSTGCISIGPGTLLNSTLPLPCSIVFAIPVPSPAPFYPVDVQVVFEGSSGVLKEFDFTVQNCADTENSFEPIACALPGDEVTFTNPNCDLVSPDFSELLVGGISATILSVDTTPACSVTFLIPDEASSGLQEIQFIDDLGNLLGTEEYSVAAVGVGSNYTVTFTPQIDTCHRIYFRTTQEEYCYYQADGPFEIGVPVTVTIDLQDYAECLVTVPPTSCDNAIIVTGYIQPCCTNEEALDNRVELNCVQYATEDCGLYSVKCNSSNCGTFTKSNCFALGCTGINDLTEYAFRGNESIPDNTVYVCSEGNGVQNTPNSTYTITKLSSVSATIYGDNILPLNPFNPSNWSDGGGAEWNPVGVCTDFVGDHLYVPENSSTGFSTTPGQILTNGLIYEFSFIMNSFLPTTITFSSGIGNSVPVACPGGVYPPTGTTYQITAQNGKLNIAIPSVGKGTCFQLLSLREITPNVRVTCCTCFGGEVQIEFPEDGPTSIEVYYTQCTDDGPQIATTTLTNTTSIVNCCTYGSIFPVNKFDIQYITSIVYTDTPAC